MNPIHQTELMSKMAAHRVRGNELTKRMALNPQGKQRKQLLKEIRIHQENNTKIMNEVNQEKTKLLNQLPDFMKNII